MIKPRENAMYVEGLLSVARERLVTMAGDASLTEAARLLHKGTDLVLVRSSAGQLIGVVTKTDIVGQMSRYQGVDSAVADSLAMTRDVVVCRPDEPLLDVWERMKARKIKNIPVVDKDYRPIGVLHARDILQALLEESQDEEALLRDYVMGVGYSN
jgi:CBS domain-containing protein